MGEAEPVMLDRWELQVEKNPEAPPSGDDSSSQHPSRDTLPLSVVNNYFSFGVDAQIALDFHEARGICLPSVSSLHLIHRSIDPSIHLVCSVCRVCCLIGLNCFVCLFVCFRTRV